MIQFLVQHEAAINQTLEITSKCATIVGVFALIVAYFQYRHSVQLAKQNSRRASVELAARESAHFGVDVLKRFDEMQKKIDATGSEFLKHAKVIKETEELKWDLALVTAEDRDKLKPAVADIMQSLNLLEAFAIPFAYDVADDDVGFAECGRTFVGLFEKYLTLYSGSNMRLVYRSTQTVYWRWQKRIDRENLHLQYSEVGKQFFILSEKMLLDSSGRGAQFLAALLRKIADRLSKRR